MSYTNETAIKALQEFEGLHGELSPEAEAMFCELLLEKKMPNLAGEFRKAHEESNVRRCAVLRCGCAVAPVDTPSDEIFATDLTNAGEIFSSDADVFASNERRTLPH